MATLGEGRGTDYPDTLLEQLEAAGVDRSRLDLERVAALQAWLDTPASARPPALCSLRASATEALARPYYYILDGHRPIPVVNALAWGAWFETTDRTVARTHVTADIEVSTVFLGLNHAWDFRPDAAPILFATMVFGGELDGECDRYATWAEAEAGHLAMCVRVQTTLGTGACAPGSICEACFDAPATGVQPAPWGGEMGVCWGCRHREELSHE